MDLDPALATARQLAARTKQQRAIIEQEDYLRGLPNLKRMTSLALTGLACASVVTLTFLPALLTLILPLADRFGARRKRTEVTD